MRIVFLDIDGVLNSRAWFKGREEKGTLGEIDPDAAARVQRLCDQTGAQIVISSTWRLIHQMNAIRSMLKRRGLTTPVIGKTPALPEKDRGHEIQQWLVMANLFPKKPTGIVIIDDDADMAHLHPWLVKTSFDTGFTDYHVGKAVEMLSRPVPVPVSVLSPSNPPEGT